MQLSTTETVPDGDVEEVLGIAQGNTVRAKHVGRDITQAIRNITGGELKSYSTLLSDARDEAIDRMTAEAESLGADAVVTIRLETSEIAQGAAEIVAYGTAVRLA